MVRISSILLMSSSIQNLKGLFPGRIAPNERVIFFPTSASQWNATHWQVPIHGWIFQPKEDSKKRAAFRSLLRRALKVRSQSTEERILDHRIKAFVVDNEGLKRPAITFATTTSEGKEYSMLPSTQDGHFQTTLMIPEDELFPPYITCNSVGATEQQHRQSVNFFAQSTDGQRRYDGTVYLVPPTGITIVSDIDDTIKITDVTRKREMLRNTFMREFQDVPGMSQVYQKWCSNTDSAAAGFTSIPPADVDSGGGDDDSTKEGRPPQPNVHLHFLSASLYQLYEELESFRIKCGFPPATYSLKTVRPKKATQTIRTLLEDPLEFKRRALRMLFERYPQRDFVLVGDTGEKDPQIYASMAQEYPHQVLAIYLRSVSKGPLDNVGIRVQQVMNDHGIENQKWTVFQDASELMNVDLSTLTMPSSPSSNKRPVVGGGGGGEGPLSSSSSIPPST